MNQPPKTPSEFPEENTRPDIPRTIRPCGCALELAADLLAARVRELLDKVAFGQWEPAVRLHNALDAYFEVRAKDVIDRASTEPP